MSDEIGVKISQLPAASSVSRSALVPVVTPTLDTQAGTVAQIIEDLSEGKVLATGSDTPRALNIRFGERINVKDFGAVGDGVTDDSGAIKDAIAAAAATLVSDGSYSVCVSTVFFPAGNYIFSGAAATTIGTVVLHGDGPNSARITLTNSDYLLKPASLNALSLRYLNFSGGKGVLKITGGGTNVASMFDVFSCVFEDYTECALGSLSSDMPYWHISENTFIGTSAWTSKGIALAGLADGSVIEKNAFLRNLYGIKLAKWGSAYIRENDFIRWSSHVSAVTDIWLVATGTSYTNLVGLIITSNKFGNENLNTTDFRTLIAAADTGSGDFVSQNHATTDLGASLFYVAAGVSFFGNRWVNISNFANGFISSYTPFMAFIDIRGNYTDGGYYSTAPWLKQLGTFVQDRLNQSVYVQIGPGTTDGMNYLMPNMSDNPTGLYDDPFGYAQGQADYMQQFGSGSDSAYASLAEVVDVSASFGGTASKGAIADCYGNAGAATITWANVNQYSVLSFTPLMAKKPVWIELDMKLSGSNPMPYTYIEVRNNAGSLILFRRIVNLTSEWRRYRFWWKPNDTSAVQFLFPAALQPYTVSQTSIDVGRVAIYQANEPVGHAQIYPPTLTLLDGVTAPAASISNRAIIYVDTADGDLKVRFADGTVKTIVTDT